MFIMHLALQGCLRAHDVPYGLTPDTGGHIRYLLELVDAAGRRPDIHRQEIVVRRFDDARLGALYGGPGERIDDTTRIVRLPGAVPGYLAKEDMHRDLDALADNLVAHIGALDERPDMIHAHYADAGWLAARMKERLGIPFAFTAHSLGHVKRRAGAKHAGAKHAGAKHARAKSAAAKHGGGGHAGGTSGDGLDRRIALEEDAIGAADRIVCSSFDEAELQYRYYDAYRPAIARVNPPGCDLAAFGPAAGAAASARDAEADAWVERNVGRFLADPDKPCLLAIARPVAKKNLTGLVRAYAECPALRERANLVVFAGCREDIADEDDEPRAVLDELLRLVDRHDLWGHVALPKTHEAGHVPAMFRHAARRRGLHVNVALNEPFGLTFLEAAASGLPVVATDSGGPNDIVGRCRNGALVDPLDRGAIAEAALALLDDPERWDEAARNGLAGSRYYRWERHAAAYARDVAALIHPRVPVMMPRYDRLLVCDIDDTLTGDRSALGRLHAWLADHPRTGFGIATGRSLHPALELIEEWGIPAPSFLITAVGSEIHHAREGGLHRLDVDASWPGIARRFWDEEAIVATLAGVAGLTRQPAREQRAFKLSYFTDEPARALAARRALEAAGLRFEMVHSHHRFLDIMPAGVAKGQAIEHVARGFGVPMSRVAAAGDSGNDRSMLERVGHPIVVGNHNGELADLRARRGAYFATGRFAAGVLEGVARQHGEG